MPEIVHVPVVDLLLDPENPRIAGGATSQQETALQLAQQQSERIVRIAEDIVKHHLDPTSLPLVMATGDRRKQYRILEGNRRVLALKALETPALVAPALSSAANRKLTRLAAKYESDPITTVACVLFSPEEEEEALHWVALRHTGPNQGIGIVPWEAPERARFEEAHKGTPRPAQQLIDFVEESGTLSAAARSSTQKILTNVERLVETTEVREKLGLGLLQGRLIAHFPEEELLKPLTRIVEDLKTGAVSVPDLYKADQRRKYVDALPASAKPKSSTRLKTPVFLDSLTAAPAPPAPKRPKPVKRKPARTTVVPSDAPIDVTHPRINSIYYELTTLNTELYPNACAVLLRVFVELSVDHFLTARAIATTPADVLAKRLRMAAADLESRSLIERKVRVAVDTVASSKTLGPGVATLHQYVHNEHVYPTTTDLRATWDTLQPFIEQVWPVT